MLLALLVIGQLTKPPLQAHAALQGQDAMGAHIGTLGFQEGFGLTYRHLGPPSGNNIDTFLAAYAPLSFVTVGASVEYTRLLGNRRYVQGGIGLAVRPFTSFTFALAYKPFLGMGELTGYNLGSWDVGVGWRPARWFAATAGIEAFNAPTVGEVSLPRTYALGVAFRPLRTDWITLGFDARLRETTHYEEWPSARGTLDFRPLSWLGLMTSVSTRGEVFVGLSLRERHLDVGGAIGLDPAGGLSGSYAYASFASEAREGIDFTGKKTVQLGLRDELRPTDGWWIFRMQKPPFGEIPLELYALAERADVTSVRLVFQGFDCNLATLHEIRDAIAYLRKKGKYVFAELGDADDKDLFVASAANEIIIEPEATLSFNGLKVVLRTFKGTLDKLGARVEAEASGNYKNSPDAFTKDEPGKYQLEAQNLLLDRFYESLITAVSEGRKLPKARVEQLLSKGLFTGEEAKAAGLVDQLARDPDPAARLPGSRYDNLWNVHRTPKRDTWNEPPAIALVQIKGTITGGESFEDPFGLFPIAGAQTIVRALEEARHDDNVKAVVLRIDSPGGDVLASDFIWQAVKRVKLSKPIIVSMGDIAASGGYYAALPANVIFAQPETVTGSIGVFTFKLDLSGLFEKIGIKNTVLKRGIHADLFDNTRALTPEEHVILHDYVEKEYQAFITKVAHARNMTTAQVDAVARGRIWSGKDALQHGLVDKLGGLVDAINEAKRLAGYDDATVLGIQPVPALGAPLGRFVAEAQAKLGMGTQRFELSDMAGWFVRMQQAFSAKAMYLYPYQMQVE